MGSSGLDTSCSHWETQVASGNRCAQTDTRGSHSKVQFLEVTLSSMPSCLCQQHEEVSMWLPPGDLCLCALGKDISTRRELRACSIEGPPLLGTLFSKPLVRDPQDHMPSRESTESTWDLCRAPRDRGHRGPVPAPRTYTRAAQSRDGRTRSTLASPNSPVP